MTSERWHRIEELFQKAVDLTPAARTPFLDTACGDDPELQREVASLLDCDSTQGEPLAEVVAGAVRGLPADEYLRQIGPYKLEKQLGHGGMGTVYLASREGEFQRRVAIKVIKRGLDTEHHRNRFRFERRILARLDHAGIARLLDGGATEDGLPYLVMELVDGQPITQYATEQKLTIPHRLELFRKVCAAVQYAHRNLVVHRDIKPSNILITKEGEPKLLDFGIAKLLDTGPGQASTARMLTPDYASPEQVRGAPITTSTDIYSLGVLLYELLTGVKPYQVKMLGALEMQRVICEVEPKLPSEMTDAKMADALRGDLDNIVIKTLRKEPRDRYQSVEEFSRDIARYLDGMPVMARPSTLWYQVSKLARRHALALSAAAAVLLSLTATIVVTTRQTRRAERRLEQVRKLANTFLYDFHDSIQALPGSGEVRAAMVQTALRYLRDVEREGTSDDVEWDIANAYERVGDVQGNPGMANLGNTTDAGSSYRRSIEIKERIARKASTADRSRSLATAYFKLGDIHLVRGENDAALASFAQGQAAAASASSGDPDDLELQARGYSRIAQVKSNAGDLDGSTEAYRQSKELLTKLVAAAPTLANRSALATVRMRLCYAFLAAGDLEAALPELKETVKMDEEIVRQAPLQTPFQQALFQARTALGDLYGSPYHITLGDLAAAEPYYRSILEQAEKMLTLDPASVQARSDLAYAIRRLSLTYRDKEPRRAVEAYHKALDINAKLRQADSGNAELLRDRGFALFEIGDLSRRLDPAEGERDLREALATQQQLALRDPARSQFRQDITPTQLALADLLIDTKRLQDAKDLLEEAQTSAEKLLAESPHNMYRVRNLSDCHEEFGKLYLAMGQPAEARTRFQRSTAIWEQWRSKYPARQYDSVRLRQAMGKLAAVGD